MACIPEGWESDYDGSRWFYRYKTTGLTQYRFPRPGDEFPELVGLGFGPLDPPPGNGLASDHHVEPNSVPRATSNASATGYFDPDQFMYFGLDDGPEDNTTVDKAQRQSPPADKDKPAPAELPGGSAQIPSPVGLVAELASGDTAKCAEELAPIELDATQIAREPLKTDLHQSGPAELSTRRNPAEKKETPQRAGQDAVQSVGEYPLVSASFASRPLKATVSPVRAATDDTASSTHPEQKVIASQRPTGAQPNQDKDETREPAQEIVKKGSEKSSRNSITLSSVPVPQSQNNGLSSIEQKRHSLSGPVESSEPTPNIPGTLRPPSNPRTSPTISTPPPQAEASPVPASLRPAAAPVQDGPRRKPVQSAVVIIPGSGARHGSISFNTGLTAVDTSLTQVPSVLKPTYGQQSSPIHQRPLQTPIDNIHPGAHRANTLPTQPSSYTTPPPKIGGPGIYVFQEIPPATGPKTEQSNPHNHVAVSPNSNSQGTSSQEPHQSTGRPQSNSPHSSHGSIPSSPMSQNKPQQRPPLSQRPENANSAPGIPLAGSINIPIRPHSVPQPGIISPPESARPNHGTQAQPQVSSQQTSIPGTSQNFQVSQSLPATPAPVINTHHYHHSSAANPSNSHAQSVQGHSHGLTAAVHASGGFWSNVSNNPTDIQAVVSHQQNTIQRPPSNSFSSQRPPDSHPAAYAANHWPNQNTPTGNSAGLHKPQSPTTQAVSPLHSQVSSPSPSITSLYRPPSSASSYMQGATGQNRPPSAITHQNPTQAIRPTVVQIPQTQGNQQTTQSPNPPSTGASKPFPMLPGQVKPLPSQVGSPPVPMPIQSVPSVTQVQRPQAQIGPTSPSQQQPGNQNVAQATYRPPNQQYANANQAPPGAGQLTPAISQHGQHQSTIQMNPAQQHAPVQSPSNTQNPSGYLQQNIGQVNQTPGWQNGQPGTNLTQGIPIQPQTSQMVQPPNTTNIPASSTQPSFNQLMGQQQPQQQQHQQQQSTQPSALNTGFYQIPGQGKPFTSAQAAAALSGAGKKMKKWAKKTLQSPAMKQTTAVLGGAVIAESFGINGNTGASLAGRIYNNHQGQLQGQFQGQPQGQLQVQGGQVQRPPGLQHAYTAPPQPQVQTQTQIQTLQGANAISAQVQATSYPQVQQGQQPVSIQSPGRPPVLQNPGLIGAVAGNSSASQPGMVQQPMMNQRPPYQISRPPVGRPQIPQTLQPTNFGQQTYQGLPNQQVFRPPLSQPPGQPFGQPLSQSPGQPFYQVQPNQATYQIAPNQPAYQNQGAPDPYAAVGAAVGVALSALAGGRNGAPPPTDPPQHQTANPEPQHEPEQHHTEHAGSHQEPYPGQHNEGHPEQSHTEQPGQHYENNSEQQYANQSEQHHESYAEQNYTTHPEQHQEPYIETHQQAHTEQQYTDQSGQQNISYSNENHDPYSEPPQGESQTAVNSTSEPYLAPQPENIVINNTVINNIENTAMAETTQTNTAYIDSTNTTNTSAEATAYVDGTYTDATNANTNPPTFSDMAYTDTTNMNAEGMIFSDTTYMDSCTMNAGTSAYTGTAYVDPSYTDTPPASSYADAAYVDAAAMSTCINVDVSVDMGQGVYVQDQAGMMDMGGMGMGMGMEGSMGVDASASYVDSSTVDYSGGDWGGGGEW